MTELCPHGKHLGAVCVPCAEDEIIGAQWDENNMYIEAERQATGLDAPYYDIPKTVECIQDAIEYLNLNFAQGNILKSLWREHGTQTKATDPLYEAEKRFYFAKRELERVRNLPNGKEARERLSNGEKG